MTEKFLEMNFLPKFITKNHRPKNLLFLSIGVFSAVYLFKQPFFHDFLLGLGRSAYLAAFLGGILFVSTFTFSIGAATLLALSEALDLWLIAVFAGFGAVVGDLIVFQFVRAKGAIDELTNLFHFFRSEKISKLLHSKYFAWTLPVLGALIIASPLPDELGVSLLGISRLKTWEFIAISFLLNSFGIWIVLAGSAILIQP